VRSRENGFYAILLLLLTFMMAASILLGDLVSASTSRTQRDNDTVAVLTQAKQALIARAALDINRPGSLPCPARDTSGVAPAVTGIPGDPCNPSIGSATTGANRNYLVGRLPWSTLKLPELKDKDNEPLWYAIADEFRDVDANRINSNMQGSLKVYGSAPADKIVAIIFAPGAPLPWQNRDPSSAAALNNVANYLEGENDYTLDPSGENDFEFEAQPRSATFNDILVVITQQELMDAVENVVAARIEKEIKPWLTRYYADWGDYPFAAPFDPTVSSVGQSATTGPGPGPELTAGQFPLVEPGSGTNEVRWSSSPSAPAKVWGSGPGNLGWASSCFRLSSMTTIQCDIYHDDDLSVRFSVTLRRAGLGFFPKPRFGSNQPYAPAYSYTGASSTPVVESAGLTASGDADVTIRFPVNGWGSPTQVTLTLPPDSQLMTEQNTAFYATEWFFRNHWDRVTYYTIDPCAEPGGVPCPPTLTLKQAGASDIQTRALLVLAGRPTTAQAASRDPPVSSPPLADYFEQENASASAVFRKALRATDFNDKVVVVGP
jgi:hypothetical protein